MNKIVGLLIIMAVISKADDRHVFLQANGLYGAHEYKKAQEAYESIMQKGPAVYYNLASTYYKQGDYLSAYGNLLRAQRDAPFAMRHDIAHNINLVESRLAQEGIIQPSAAQSSFILHSIQAIPLLVWQIMLLLVCFLLFFCCCKMQQKNYLRKLTILLSCIAFILFGALYAKYRIMLPRGIIMQHSSHVFAGPGEQYQRLHSLDKAAMVILLEQHDGWYKINYNNAYGWVSAQQVMVV